MNKPKVHLLANPAAIYSKQGAGLNAAITAIQSRGIQVINVTTKTSFEAEKAAHQIVASGAKRIIVLGGDGMVHLAIQAVARKSTVLGIVPFGTGNDFARGVGLPTDFERGIDAALAPARPIDLIRIDGNRWAASVATLGFSVAVNLRANRMNRPKGPSKYTVATLRELPRLKTGFYDLRVDGIMYQKSATLVTIANTSRFGGGMQIAPSADPTDGILNLTLVGSIGRIELLRWFRKVYDGSHLDHPAITTLSGRQIEILQAPTQLCADGELIRQKSARIEAVPRALQLAGSISLVT